MAFASVSTLGTIVTPKSSGTTSVIDLTAAVSVGDLIIVGTCWNNVGTSEAITDELTCADSDGTNVYTKVREYTMSSGSAGDGATVAIFYCVATDALADTATITVTSGSAQTPKVSGAWLFTIDEAAVAVEQVTEDGAASGVPAAVSLSSMASREYLLLHMGGETRSSTWTEDADYTLMWEIETSGGSAASNINLMGSYRIATLTDDTATADSNTETAYSQILAAIYEAAGGTTNEETGAAPADTTASATDVYEASETGAGAPDTIAAGADVFEAAETGAPTADTVAAGADVFEASETVASPAGTFASGVAVKTAGGTEFPKDGAAAAGAVSAAQDVFEATEAGASAADTVTAATDVFEAAETGGLTAGTTSAATDVFEATEEGAGLADTLLAGVSQLVSGGGTTYNKTGAGVTSSAAAAADAFEATETGSTYAGTLYVGTDVYEAVEAGAAMCATLLAGLEGDLVFVTAHFDQPSPAGGVDGGNPGAGHFDQPHPGMVLT